MAGMGRTGIYIILPCDLPFITDMAEHSKAL